MGLRSRDEGEGRSARRLSPPRKSKCSLQAARLEISTGKLASIPRPMARESWRKSFVLLHDWTLVCTISCIIVHSEAGNMQPDTELNFQGGALGDWLPEERQRLILELLAREGRVVAQALAQRFGTSEDTIRRDLRELAAAGLCQRVYGGALPRSPASGSLIERQDVAPESKRILGEAMAKSMLAAGQVVFVDAGSTNLAAVRALPPTGEALTLVTNAPAVAAEAALRDYVDLIVIGGRFDRQSGGALGAKAMHDVAGLRPDVYLLGACALDVEAGIGEFGFEETELKRVLVRQSHRVVCAATSDKLGTRAPFSVAPLNILNDLLLEPDAPAAHVEAFRRAGVPVRLAGKGVPE